MKSQTKQYVSKSPVDWTKTPEYREAVLMKVLRAMKSYGLQPWMTKELKDLGLSL